MDSIRVKSIDTWCDLIPYGIQALTGEACAYSMRTLFDLNSEGASLVSSFLGIKPDGFQANWNSQVNETPAVASVMLTADTVLELCVYTLFVRYNVPFVYAAVSPNGKRPQLPVIGTKERYCGNQSYWLGFANFARLHHQPAEDGRCVHMASGRTT